MSEHLTGAAVAEAPRPGSPLSGLNNPIIQFSPPPAACLRPYQRDAVAAILRARERGLRRAAVVMATGSGKTVVAAEVARQIGGGTLVIAHRDELIAQAADQFARATPGAGIGVVKGARNEVGADIVIASVQTLARPSRLDQLAGRPFGLIVVDECHHATAESYRAALDRLQRPGCFVLGLTATLDRGDGEPLGEVFDEVVYEIGLLPLIEAGFLVDLRAVRIGVGMNLDDVRVRGGDFVGGDLSGAFLRTGGPAVVANAIATHAADRRSILVFTPSVEAAHRTAAVCRSRGLEAEAIDGATPVETRREIVGRFRDGDLRILTNCAVATEGFDAPAIDCVVIARPTTSPVLYRQMVGRSTRTHPGKADALIIDLAGSTRRHRLQSVAKLGGLDDWRMGAGESLVEAVDRWNFEQSRKAAASAPGPLTSRAVDPLGRDRPSILQDRGAAWRGHPASAKQVSYLRALGVVPPPGLTKGQASDLITEAKSAQRWTVVRPPRLAPAPVSGEQRGASA